MHRSRGNGTFTHFLQRHAGITCAWAALATADAAAEIDRVLIAVRDQRLAGYLLLPTDIGEAPVDPPTAPLPAPVNITDPTALDAFAAAASRLLDTAGGTGRRQPPRRAAGAPAGRGRAAGQPALGRPAPARDVDVGQEPGR